MNRTHVFFIGKLRHFQSLGLDNEFEAQWFGDEILAFNAVAETKPPLIVLDYSLRNAGTPGYIELLLQASSASRIVVTGSLADEEIIDVLVAGAQGYAEQRELSRVGNKMLRAIKQDEAWVSRKVVAKLLQRLRQVEAESREQVHTCTLGVDNE